jgi:hypothetical protein
MRARLNVRVRLCLILRGMMINSVYLERVIIDSKDAVCGKRLNKSRFCMKGMLYI